MMNSLFSRLLTACLLLVIVFFILIYFVTNQSYTNNLLNVKQKELQFANHLLISSSSLGYDNIEMPEDLRETRFDEFESGLYGFVTDIQGKILWVSYSAHSIEFDPVVFKNNKLTPGDNEFRESNQYYISHHTVEWELKDELQLLVFTVVEDKLETAENITNFRKSISQWFIIGALLFILILYITLRWGPHPLSRLALDIKRIETGYNKKLEDKYPAELKGLTHNLNNLVDSEHKQRERYQNTLSDLAHSLKTPLAVTQAELETNKNSKEKEPLIAEQVTRMREIITHQLQRAVISSPNRINEKVNLFECIRKISSALGKVHQERNIHFNNKIPEGLCFRGDQRDLMEVIGNIMDNAFKAANNCVEVTADTHTDQLIIEIHDDGMGIPKEKRDLILTRGQRLDTKVSGQGIGLDVVRDIIESYHGDISIEQSHLGGTLFRLSFTH